MANKDDSIDYLEYMKGVLTLENCLVIHHSCESKLNQTRRLQIQNR